MMLSFQGNMERHQRMVRARFSTDTDCSPPQRHMHAASCDNISGVATASDAIEVRHNVERAL